MNQKTIIYSLILVVISLIVGGGFYWYSSQFAPEVSIIKFANQKPQVLGEETQQNELI